MCHSSGHNLKRKELTKLTIIMCWQVATTGQAIARQGDVTDGMYFVMSGTLAVFVNGNLVGNVRENEYFGTVQAV